MMTLNLMLMLIIETVILKFTFNEMFNEFVAVNATIIVINVFVTYFFHSANL